jgi:indoleamine 2,3-dioxygenase
MKAHMPKPHRALLASIDPQLIRGQVRAWARASTTEAYNACLEAVVEFRTLHLHFANAYIATKVEDPRGTGGTDFMRWLKQIRDETQQQFL